MKTFELLYGNAFRRVAARYQVVLGVRCPNPLGDTLLREGAPSKNFHMKAKSSPTGPTAGYIAEDPRYSKLTPTAYAQQRRYIEQAVAKGAQAQALVLSASRLRELLDKGELSRTADGRYAAAYPGGTCVFTIDAQGRVYDENMNPVNVMTNAPEVGAPPTELRPITADYDLFAIIPRAQQSYNPTPMSAAPQLRRGSFDVSFLRSPPPRGGPMDPNRGNLHHFASVIIDRLNREAGICGYTGGKLVWHGDETNNPFSPGFDPKDRPIFFLPDGSSVQVLSQPDLLAFYAKLKSQGYSPDYSPRFGF